MQQLPTISRSIQDFTRLDPRNSNNSFAGSSFRYNNITLDGAVNNGAIGFSPSLGGQGGTSGLPGGSARSNPISLDAIQEIQASVAPYDVKLGNFTGGSINAVTRSGTNDFHGSMYGYGRNLSHHGQERGRHGLENRVVVPRLPDGFPPGWAGYQEQAVFLREQRDCAPHRAAVLRRRHARLAGDGGPGPAAYGQAAKHLRLQRGRLRRL
ncbi:MAG: hypothetical protein WKG07_07870 [Hymenobacter sp.]